MKEWLRRRPLLANFLAGIAVLAAAGLLVVEHFRDKASGGGAASYYSQF